jgi:serine/threonine protein kinase
MIDNSNWEFIYKLEEGYLCSTNVLYVPTISPEKDKMCMHFTEDANVYMQKSCVPRNTELMEDFFQRELKYLTLFQDKPWCPKLLDSDATERKILVEFNKESLNKPIRTETRSLDKEFPNWEEDLFNILKDIHDSGYIKASIYPHCFFYTNSGQLKMIDYYATIEQDDTLIHKSLIEPIIGVDSQQRFIEVKEGDYYQMRDHFKNSLKTWIKWPGDPLPKFYDRIFGNNE